VQHDEIRHWIDFACQRCGCPELGKQIEYTFNGRLRRIAGRAFTAFDDGQLVRPRFELARFLARLTTQQFIQTVVHETCHLADAYLFGPRRREFEGHGLPWKRLMLKCGVRPERFLRIECAEPRIVVRGTISLTGLVVAVCDCHGRHKISLWAARRIRQGHVERCEICKQPLRLPYG
jgi:predicted SprT family Zn-dependent metalloprotease